MCVLKSVCEYVFASVCVCACVRLCVCVCVCLCVCEREREKREFVLAYACMFFEESLKMFYFLLGLQVFRGQCFEIHLVHPKFDNEHRPLFREMFISF